MLHFFGILLINERKIIAKSFFLCRRKKRTLCHTLVNSRLDPFIGLTPSLAFEPGIKAVECCAQTTSNFLNRIPSFSDLLDGFNLKFMGITLAAHVILLKSFFYNSRVSKKLGAIHFILFQFKNCLISRNLHCIESYYHKLSICL